MTAAGRTQAERRATSERLLLEATAELVARQGLRHTSLAEIGLRAGYSHGLVRHLFGSKAGLIDRLYELVDQTYQARSSERVAQASGLSGVKALCEVYLSSVSDDNPLGRAAVVLWTESITGGSEYDRTRDEDRLRGAFAVHLREAIAAGEVREALDPDVTAYVLLGLLRGVALQLHSGASKAQTARVRREVDLLVDAMLRR